MIKEYLDEMFETYHDDFISDGMTEEEFHEWILDRFKEEIIEIKNEYFEKYNKSGDNIDYEKYSFLNKLELKISK